jgi:hypothetical protein
MNFVWRLMKPYLPALSSQNTAPGFFEDIAPELAQP